ARGATRISRPRDRARAVAPRLLPRPIPAAGLLTRFPGRPDRVLPRALHEEAAAVLRHDRFHRGEPRWIVYGRAARPTRVLQRAARRSARVASRFALDRARRANFRAGLDRRADYFPPRE